MKEAGVSERHQGNELLTLIYFAKHLGKRILNRITSCKTTIQFLDTKKRTKTVNPDEKWKITWNDYLGTVKHFYRFLYNHRGITNLIPTSERKTHPFMQINEVKTKRLTPYSE